MRGELAVESRLVQVFSDTPDWATFQLGRSTSTQEPEHRNSTFRSTLRTMALNPVPNTIGHETT